MMARKMQPSDLHHVDGGRQAREAKARNRVHSQHQAHGPEHWQEAHSPTEPATVRTYLEDKATGAMKPVQVRSPAKRRKADNRVWEAMTVNQERAAIRIERGYDLITGGQGYATLPPEVRDRAREADDQTEIAVALEQDYFEWGVRCGREDLTMHPVAIAWLGGAIRYRNLTGATESATVGRVSCFLMRWRSIAR